MKKKKPELFSNYQFRDLVNEYVQGELSRQILILFYVEDMTQDEIADRLHVTISKIKRDCMKYGMPIFAMMGYKMTD